MNTLAPVGDGQSDLDTFIEFLFEGLDGYMYLVAKDAHSLQWNQQFYHYPTGVPALKKDILATTPTYEVYLAPALYNDPEGTAEKENVKVTNVAWCDFDGNTPDDFGQFEPSLVIRSSDEGNEHVYWKLDSPVEGADAIEDITHRLSYGFGADSSGWDATQVLRPPSTVNHKRQRSVSLLHYEPIEYSRDSFSVLAEPPTQISTSNWQIGELPSVQDVLLRHAFGPDMVLLFQKSKEQVTDRSSSLMQAAYGCCQLGLRDVEIFVILKMLDDTWEKFKDRRDRDRRLAQIITRARDKYPDDESDESSNPVLAFDYKSFMSTKLEVDWAVERMLLSGGSMLFAGPSGIGKTQLALQFMKAIALGKNYLGYNIVEPKKIGFWSLEMGHAELQIFMQAQDVDLTDAERDLLAENLMILPIGESWPLNQQHGQDQMELLIQEFGLQGVFIDSIGSAIIGNINAQEVVQTYNNYVDRMRRRHGIFWWAIHHTRKSSPGNNIGGQDDVYGDQYLVNRASSVYGILPGKDGTIKVDNWKNRLSSKEAKYYLTRTPSLNFERIGAVSGGEAAVVPAPVPEEGEVSDVAGNGFGL